MIRFPIIMQFNCRIFFWINICKRANHIQPYYARCSMNWKEPFQYNKTAWKCSRAGPANTRNQGVRRTRMGKGRKAGTWISIDRLKHRLKLISGVNHSKSKMKIIFREHRCLISAARAQPLSTHVSYTSPICHKALGYRWLWRLTRPLPSPWTKPSCILTLPLAFWNLWAWGSGESHRNPFTGISLPLPQARYPRTEKVASPSVSFLPSLYEATWAWQLRVWQRKRERVEHSAELQPMNLASQKSMILSFPNGDND